MMSQCLTVWSSTGGTVREGRPKRAAALDERDGGSAMISRFVSSELAVLAWMNEQKTCLNEKNAGVWSSLSGYLQTYLSHSSPMRTQPAVNIEHVMEHRVTETSGHNLTRHGSRSIFLLAEKLAPRQTQAYVANLSQLHRHVLSLQLYVLKQFSLLQLHMQTQQSH